MRSALKWGDIGPKVQALQRALGINESCIYGKNTSRHAGFTTSELVLLDKIESSGKNFDDIPWKFDPLKEKQIVESDFDKCAKLVGCEPEVIKAIFRVESAGEGFSKDGRIKIQFEPHHFYRYSGHRVPNGVENQAEEYIAFGNAASINTEAALLSTSWGAAQIMGFNFENAGYKDVRGFVWDMIVGGEVKHLEAMTKVLINFGLSGALYHRNWAAIARKYNGAGYAKFRYDEKLEEAYRKIKDGK